MANLEERRHELEKTRVQALSLQREVGNTYKQKKLAQLAFEGNQAGLLQAKESIEDFKDRLRAANMELAKRGKDCETLRERIERTRGDAASKARKVLIQQEAGAFMERTGGSIAEREKDVSLLCESLLTDLHERHERDVAMETRGLSIEPEKQIHEDGCVLIYGPKGTNRFMMRITAGLTVGELKATAAEYFGLYEDDFSIVDNSGAMWPTRGVLRQEFVRLHGVAWKKKLSPLFMRLRTENPDRLEQMVSFDPFAERSIGGEVDMRSKIISENPFATGRLLRVYESKKAFMHALFVTVGFILVLLTSLNTRRNSQSALRINEAVRGGILNEGFGPFRQLGFMDVTRADDIYGWLDGPVRRTLFALDITIPDHVVNALPFRPISLYNFPIGGVRIHQARVAPDSCTIASVIPPGFVSECYADYSSSSKSKDGFRVAQTVNDTRGFRYQSVKDLNGEADDVELRSSSYGGDGFVVDFNINNMTALEWTTEMTRLRDLEWIDRGTRLVGLMFATYNANYDIISHHRFYVEITAGGTFLPSYRSYAVYPGTYDSIEYFFQLVLDLVMFAFVMYFCYREWKQLQDFAEPYGTRRYKYAYAFRDYCKDPWNLYELLIITCYFTALHGRLRVFADRRRNLTFPQAQYIEYGSIGYWFEIYYTFDGALILLAFVKLFQFVAMSKRMSLIWLTIAQAGKPLSLFSVMFALMLFGFVLLGHEVFGAEVLEFSEIQSTARTLLLMLIGPVFDYETLRRVNRVWAPVFYLLFQCVFFFVFVQIFLAIINYTYRLLRRRYFHAPVTTQADFANFWSVLIGILPAAEELRMRWEARKQRDEVIRRRVEKQALAQLNQIKGMASR